MAYTVPNKTTGQTYTAAELNQLREIFAVGSRTIDAVPLPEGYRITTDAGDLVIQKDGTTVANFNKNETEFNSSLKAVLGGFQLGDVFLIGSSGVDISHVNNISGEAKIPQGTKVRLDGSGFSRMVDYEIMPSQVDSNGSVDSSQSTPLSWSTTSPNNFILFDTAFYPAEDYIGEIEYMVTDAGTGDTLVRFKNTVSLSSDVLANINHIFPVISPSGASVNVNVTKSDGSSILCRPILGNASEAFRETKLSLFIEHNVKTEKTFNGFANYSNSLSSQLVSSSWVSLLNDGFGAKTNTSNLPSGVSSMLSSNNIDLSELELGDWVVIRPDLEITPQTNNQQAKVRIHIGVAPNDYYLEEILGKMDSGAGNSYRFTPTILTYVGDSDTLLNPVEIQVFCSGTSYVKNNGFAIGINKRLA